MVAAAAKVNGSYRIAWGRATASNVSSIGTRVRDSGWSTHAETGRPRWGPASAAASTPDPTKPNAATAPNPGEAMDDRLER
jgi:hypothetical protein